ncbi:MAG: DUF6265 family protein [Pyrinomonadaceae bacterium]
MISILMVAAVEVTGSVQTKGSLGDLAWLSGCWEGRQRDAVIEEIWSKPAGLSMLGLGRTVKNGKTVSFEFMQIREENGTLVFLPQPQGGTRVPFPLKDTFGGKMTFENKEHDFPQRVIYERKGPGLLLASVEGLHKGKEEREEFQMKKVRCN